ncbi:MAG TPA: ABC transporter permease, partial [Chitinophagaceae bacterium]|nr:ABC transporter permease [Chitinophagaceae bacterium]
IIIQFHSGYDNFHANKDRIYRILTEYHHADTKDVFNGKGVPPGFPQVLKSSFNQVEQVAPLLAGNNDQVLVLNSKSEPVKKIKEAKGLFYTTPSFFSIFNFPLLAGSYETLKDPNSALLTKETAERYFDDWKTAIGKTIKLNNTEIVKITGILAAIPANTGFQLKIVVSYGTGRTKNMVKSADYDGTSGNFGCFVLLHPNTNIAAFTTQLKTWSKKLKSAGNNDVQIIQPLRDIHYDTKTGDFTNKTISHQLVNVLWMIAAFILLIACVNFINLSAAQAVNRAKEVGVRKVLGSSKFQLKLQFITETFLIVAASVILSLLMVSLSLPFFNKMLELSVGIGPDNGLAIGVFLLAISVLVTLLAGFYPSIVLARFNPVTALKSKLAAKSAKGISLRRGLVVFQFVIAQSLIIGTLVIVKQMSYFSGQSLGFDKDAIVNIPLPADSISNTRLGYLKTQLQKINGIQGVSLSSNTPVEDNIDNWTMFNFDHAAKQTTFYSIIKTADNDYVPTYKLPLIAGRNIEASDTMKEFLVNEMLLKNLGILNPQEALNKEIKFNDRMKGTIVGVLKDFNTRSFRDGLAPVIVTSFKSWYNQASVKLTVTDGVPVIRSIEKIWNTTYPDFVFEYKFLDDKVESFYKQENQLAYLYKVFAVIAIFLSCLGLYGLASFMAVQRIKEVGIRKILGASVQNIVYLFSKEFIMLIAISFVIATPLAGYYMHQWLQHFSFKIELSWWIFLAGGLASVIVALATISFQAIKAAIANPVKSLRTE